jgi:hypothetical protein
MTGQLGEEVSSETARAWDSVRRVREPVAWLLLVVIAVAVLASAWQLFGLSGAPVPAAPRPVAVPAGAPAPTAPSPAAVPTGAPAPTAPSPAAVPTFGLRASVVAPQFVTGGIFLLPVLAVILVAFAGGVTDHARQVAQAAVSVQAIALGLGLVSWLGALGAHVRPGVWFLFVATDLAAMAAALIFTVAVLRSRALRPLTPQLVDFGEDHEEDVGEGNVSHGEDA